MTHVGERLQPGNGLPAGLQRRLSIGSGQIGPDANQDYTAGFGGITVSMFTKLAHGYSDRLSESADLAAAASSILLPRLFTTGLARLSR